MTAWQMSRPWERIREKLECAHCGEGFALGERCVERFRGVVGSGEKSGQPMVVEDKYDPEEVLYLHEECEEMMYELAVRSKMEDDAELMRFCAGCGCKLTGE